VPVQSDLNPQFSENRIEVPAEETTGFNGETGFIGIDQVADYDAPETRMFNLKFSSADGQDDFYNADGGKKVNWTAIAIGVGVGALAIYLMNKYKVLEK
jgi:hypothetical protein